MEFNSLDAQREACGAYIVSQRAEGWHPVRDHYDDGGVSGGTLDRPALKRLLADVEAGKIDVVVVYKIDRLSRSMLDFLKLVETFERHGVTFVSITQAFNTTSSMGRLTLNMLLSFAQFEREVSRSNAITRSNRLHSRLLASAAALGVNLDADVVNVSPQLITKGCRALARSRAVYLVRSTQYQFCDCGVRYHLHVDARLALNQLWDWRVTWLRKRRRQRRQRRPARRKRSNL